MAHAMDRSTVYCPACEAPLWSAFTLSNGQPVMAPVTPETPYYKPGCEDCPHCGQAISVSVAGKPVRLVKNERTGRVRVA